MHKTQYVHQMTCTEIIQAKKIEMQTKIMLPPKLSFLERITNKQIIAGLDTNTLEIKRGAHDTCGRSELAESKEQGLSTKLSGIYTSLVDYPALQRKEGTNLVSAKTFSTIQRMDPKKDGLRIKRNRSWLISLEPSLTCTYKQRYKHMHIHIIFKKSIFKTKNQEE